MAMTAIMVLVEDSPAGRVAIHTAFLAARRDRGHVAGLYPLPAEDRVTPDDVQVSHASLGALGQDYQAMFERVELKGSAAIEAARRGFVSVADEMEAPLQSAPPSLGGLTADFLVLAEGDPDSVAARARVFDLVVMRQPRDDPGHRVRKMLQAVLFRGGRPVLVVPPTVPATLGKRPIIAWNGSALSARAAAIARNYFTGAREVGILTVTSGKSSGPTAQDLADYVAWHGITARVIEAEPGKRRLGDVLLDEAARFEADMLVMGAYSHSLFRESLTGGVTNHVLGHAGLPLLLTH